MVAVAGLLATGGPLLVAAPALEDTFDAPEPAWRLVREGSVQRIQHQRLRIDRDGATTGVEWLRYACRPGYTARCWRPIGNAPVIDELSFELDVRCEQPGVVLAARVVLPRTRNPRTGRPLTTIIRGQRYNAPNTWRTLKVTDAPRLTAAAARLMRTRPGAPTIDERGAFVDRVVLLLPGSSNGVSLWLDNLRVEGVLNGTLAGDTGAGPILPEANSAHVPQHERVTLNASGFAIGGRPFFPRVWSHNSGPLETASEAGFNTVAFDQPPTAEQLAEAAKHKLRVLCPPPGQDRIKEKGWRSVLAWRVGGHQGGRRDSIDAARAFAERIRHTDLKLQRPLLAEADGEWSAWSRIADALVIARTGPDSEAADRLWAKRVGDIARLVRPGTPLIQRISVQPTAESLQQLTAFANLDQEGGLATDREIAAAVWSAIADRAVAVWIDAGRRLNGADAATTRLRRGLTLLNLQLELADPWLAGGVRGPRLSLVGGEPHASLLKRGRVRLLAPYLGSGTPSPGAKLVVPGAGEATLAYRLTPAGMEPLKVERVAGGASVDAAAIGIWGMALLTDDRQAVSAIAGRTATTASQAVELQLQLARDELATFSHRPQASLRVLPNPVRREAERRVSVANAAAAAKNPLRAFTEASLARNALAAADQTSPSSIDPLLRSPLDHAVANKQAAEQLDLLLAGAPRGANLLAGGDFESLDRTRQAGWTNTTLPIDGVHAGVELATQSPGHGQRSLRMFVVMAPGAPSLPLAAGDCPVWITSPPTKLSAGQLVEVIGWVRIEPGVSEHPPRVIISDTLGGKELGRVVDLAGNDPTSRWRPFRLLRRAPREAELQLTFGLSGVGAAQVDAVMIRPVQVGATPQPPARLSPVAGRPDPFQAK